LAAALAATYNTKEEIRALEARLAAAQASSLAADVVGSEKGGSGEGGGLVQQKEYIRKLKAVLKEREAELQQVTDQLKETRGQEAQFLAEVQLLQGRIKKLSSSSLARFVCLRAEPNSWRNRSQPPATGNEDTESGS
jgi:hypothetical protein